MRKFLELIGVRRPAAGRVIPLFPRWHALAVMAIAAGIIVLIHHLT